MLKMLVTAIDRRLRSRQGIVEYSTSPLCIFRMQVVTNRRDLALTDGTFISAGDRLIDLHLWNEQIPPFPPEGPTISWARRTSSAIEMSLRELAAFLARRSCFHDIAAISANLAFSTAEESDRIASLAARYGFRCASNISVSNRSLSQSLHLFGENILISMIVFCRNPAALRKSSLRRERVQMFLPRPELTRRFGTG
jgi:hypothetical protein